MFSLCFPHSTFNTNPLPLPRTRTDPVAAGVACDVSGQLRGCQYGRPSSMPSSAAASATSARGLRNEIDIIVESRRVERSRRAAGRHAARGPAASRSSLARSLCLSHTSYGRIRKRCAMCEFLGSNSVLYPLYSLTRAMGGPDRITPQKSPIVAGLSMHFGHSVYPVRK